jgi:hypothetical protein
MKIAIFGDSFADCLWFSKLKIQPQNGPGWPELLAEQYDVINFAKGGTSLYYSYDLFCKHHSQFDRVIFVSSAAERFAVHLPESNDVFHIVPGTSLNQRMSELYHYKTDLRIIQAAEDYISYVLDTEKERIFGKLIIDDICRTRSDVLLLPAFWIKDNHLIPLGHFSSMEQQYYKLSKDTINLNNLTDLRKCHLTDENNQMVYQKIVDSINKKISSISISIS